MTHPKETPVTVPTPPATTDRTAALDAVFAARLAPIEAAPADEASCVETVARAIWGATMRDEVTARDWRCALTEDDREFYRAQASAAISAMRPAAGVRDAEAALARVEALAEEYAERVENCADGFWKRHLWIVAQRLRTAISGPDATVDGQQR